MKAECLSKLILVGEGSLRRALNEYASHFHRDRNHQGQGKCPAVPRAGWAWRVSRRSCRVQGAFGIILIVRASLQESLIPSPNDSRAEGASDAGLAGTRGQHEVSPLPGCAVHLQTALEPAILAPSGIDQQTPWNRQAISVFQAKRESVLPLVFVRQEQ